MSINKTISKITITVSFALLSLVFISCEKEKITVGENTCPENYTYDQSRGRANTEGEQTYLNTSESGVFPLGGAIYPMTWDSGGVLKSETFIDFIDSSDFCTTGAFKVRMHTFFMYKTTCYSGSQEMKWDGAIFTTDKQILLYLTGNPDGIESHIFENTCLDYTYRAYVMNSNGTFGRDLSVVGGLDGVGQCSFQLKYNGNDYIPSPNENIRIYSDTSGDLASYKDPLQLTSKRKTEEGAVSLGFTIIGNTDFLCH